MPEFSDFEDSSLERGGPLHCWFCGVSDDPSYVCRECDTMICRGCNRNHLLPLSHMPEDHLTPPEQCDACGSYDVATDTKFGVLCPRCSLEALGLCGKCGWRDCRCGDLERDLGFDSGCDPVVSMAD